MSHGTYEDFRNALRGFESGWDRDRYNDGVIQDWQLDQWAGGSVASFYPQYESWGDLTDAEWDAMSYRSMNTLGFVGYQFGEALLIDLGYYDADVFYGAGAAKNNWLGNWTGKNGVNSLEDFTTKAAQEIAIQEAFGFNVKIIQDGLAQQGLSLDDFIGTTTTYVDNGQTVSVELTLTGIMAAAHLRGAYGTLSLLLNGSVSSDEYGTSILRYIDQFGGYDAPSVAASIAYFEDRITGDEGLGVPSGGGTGTGGDNGSASDDTGSSGSGGISGIPATGNGTAGVTKTTADVVITWAWGTNTVVSDFDPATDTIFVDWINADALDVTEASNGITFAVPSNNQTLTLRNVSFDDLSAANFTILDDTAAAEILALVGAPAGGDGGTDQSGGDDHSDGIDLGGSHGGGADHGSGDGSGADHGDHGGMTGTMHLIGGGAEGRVIDGFDPNVDMIHLLDTVVAEYFAIFEESGDALGTTVRIEITRADGVAEQIIFTGISLSDLTLSNFSVANQGVLNEVASAIGAVVTTPGEGGYTLADDSDGSNPAATTGTTSAGGVKFKADSNADDIIGFRPGIDELDFGNVSVHGMIITKSPAAEIVIDSPWSDAAQIVRGVTYQDVTIDDFGVVGNEHFRQDMGAVVSWEQDIGPREANTVYIRSHEYGFSETIDGFDPTSMKISFLYFGTRERLSVEDTADGMVISSIPSGQSFTFTGVSKSDLVPGLVEFHFDQVMEDNLETPFGFDQNDVTLVSRTDLLTPKAPPGATTDGFQTRTGDMGGATAGIPTDGSGGDTGGSEGGATGGNTGGSGAMPDDGDAVVFGPGQDTQAFGWNWGTTTRIVGFDPSEDVLNFGSLSGTQLGVTEADGNLVFEVLGNGGDFTVLEGIQAEDLSPANLIAPNWNGIVSGNSPLMLSLIDLGYDAVA